MRCFLGFGAALLSLLVSIPVRAIDITADALGTVRFSDWKVIEFGMSEHLVERIGSESTNHGDRYSLVFDFPPTEDCQPTPAVLVARLGTYRATLTKGHMPFSYGIVGEKDTAELTATDMRKGDFFAFFEFEGFSPQNLLAAPQDSRLAFWTPPGASVPLERSAKIYFSLNGYDQAWARARTLCNAKR